MFLGWVVLVALAIVILAAASGIAILLIRTARDHPLSGQGRGDYPQSRQ